MMFGLVNHIAINRPILNALQGARLVGSTYRIRDLPRFKEQKDVIGAEYFSQRDVPRGFEPEINLFPGDKYPNYPPVIIHHKFIVIDAETESPIIYTGSANISNNSEFENDENLLEINGSPRLAHIYLAEFMRLYEHYRARAIYINYMNSQKRATPIVFALRKNRSWADEAY